MKVRVLGCGEAFDSELGNTSCLVTHSRAGTLLLDCGYQIPERLWRLKAEYPKLAGVLISHVHADHAFGIVPLLVRFWEEKRTAPLTIIGHKGTANYVRKIMNLGYPGFMKRLQFELQYLEVEEGRPYEWQGWRLEFARSQHSVANFSARITSPAGASLGMSGDGQITDATIALLSEVDFLIQEVYEMKPEIPVHSDLQTIARFVREARIGKIGVAHVSRLERAKVAKAVATLAKKDRRWSMLRPGAELQIKGSKR